MTRLRAILPGLLLSLALGGVAKALNLAFPLASALLLAILLGLVAGPWVRGVDGFTAGLTWSAKKLLRVGVAFLGLRLVFGELIAIGWLGLGLAVAVVVLVQALAIVLGRILQVPPMTAFLLGTGTAVCGASAIVAMGAAVNAREEDSAYGLGTITLLGTLGIFLFPAIGAVLGLTDFQYGVWAGAALQEMAQVVAAGFAYSTDAGEVATVVKLARVALLAPLVFATMVVLRRREGEHTGERPPLLPGFVIAFLALALARSVLPIPEAPLAWVLLADELVLASAMAALGARIDLRALVRVGFRPMALGAALALVATLLPLAVVFFIG